MKTFLATSTYRQNELHLEQVPLRRLANEYGTPLYVYSSDALISGFRALDQGLSTIPHEICFAVKSNSNLSILRLLADEGAGMDIVSGGELRRALQAGVPASRIVFSGVGKTEEEITLALQADSGRGIQAFHAESISELERIERVASRLQCKARFSVRWNPNVSARTHPYISTGLKKNKFGLDRTEIRMLLKQLPQFPSLEWVGLSCHIGSQILSLKPFQDAGALTRDLWLSLSDDLRAMGRPGLRSLDLGGGLGVSYSPKDKPVSPKAYTAWIAKLWKSFPKSNRPERLLLEPGRAISANAGVLLSTVQFIKDRGRKRFCIIDAGMNDLLRPALYSSHHEIVPVCKPTGRRRATDVVGPVCETSDRFGESVVLPESLHEGDLLAILSAGAYGMTMASNYNSRPRPAEILVAGKKWSVIRSRETIDDLMRGEIL